MPAFNTGLVVPGRDLVNNVIRTQRIGRLYIAQFAYALVAVVVYSSLFTRAVAAAAAPDSAFACQLPDSVSLMLRSSDSARLPRTTYFWIILAGPPCHPSGYAYASAACRITRAGTTHIRFCASGSVKQHTTGPRLHSADYLIIGLRQPSHLLAVAYPCALLPDAPRIFMRPFVLDNSVRFTLCLCQPRATCMQVVLPCQPSS